MSSAVLFGVYTASLPFLDADKDKVRPVIVVSKPHGQHNIVTVVPVSSKAKRELVDITLDDWQKDGLVKPSVARVHRVAALLQSDLTSQLGVLTANDQRTLLRALKELLSL